MTSSLRSSLSSSAVEILSDPSVLSELASTVEAETERVLQEGEARVRPLITKVEEEKAAVRSAQAHLSSLIGSSGTQPSDPPFTRLLNFKLYPLYKQSSLALSVLLTVRGASAVIIDVLFGMWMNGDLNVSKEFGFAIFEFAVGAAFGLYYFYL